MLRPLKSKDLKNFIYFCSQRDIYSDFYITEKNKRLFLNNYKIAKKVFNDCLKGREKCFIKEENDIIEGILLIVGYKDKSPRKYLKILSNSEKTTRHLFSYLDWKQLKNVFIKAHNKNKNLVKFDSNQKKFKPSYYARKAGFKIIAEREKEILLMFDENQLFFKRFKSKDNKNGNNK